MKNKILLCLAALMAVTGCKKKEDNGDGSTLRLSVMHNQTYRMKYVEADLTSNNVLPFNSPDGINYKVGDFKPVWRQIQENLEFTIEDVTPTDSSISSAKNAFDKKWSLDNFDGVDILNGNAADFTTYGVSEGSFVALNEHFNKLPNFKKFLDENDVVKRTVTAGDGNIYYSPYFDGYNSIERMSIMRADWVKKLLNGTGTFEADPVDKAAPVGEFFYQKIMPATLNKTIDVVNEAGTAKTTVTKNYAKNIIDILGELEVKNAETMTQALRDYIDSTYGTFYGAANRANLFVGQSAAYDSDELVALLRVVKVNKKLLTGQTEVEIKPFYPREDSTDRTSDILRWAGSSFGVRGLESRKDYLFIDTDGQIKDARVEDKTLSVLDTLNQLYKENLITNEWANVKKNTAEGSGRFNFRDAYANKANLGFMTYDYNQTTTAFNKSAAATAQPGYDLTPVLPAVCNWFNDGNYFHFSESIRSVKTDAWAINAKLTGGRLNKALQLFDYMYSEEGNKLMSFGPDEWFNGTLSYKGENIPKFKDEVYNMFISAKKAGEFNPDGTIKTLAGGAAGNYTNFLRGWLGGTFPIGYIKNQGVEYQLTHENGQKGEAKIEKAIQLGVMKVVKPSLATGENKFYSIVPTTLPFTDGEETLLKGLSTLTNNFQQTSSTYYNLLLEYVVNGYGSNSLTSDLGKEGKGLSKADLKTYINSANYLGLESYIAAQKAAYARTSS